METWLNINVRDSPSPHDHAMMNLLTITLIMSYIMMSRFWNKFINRYLLEGQTIELVWTVAPTITLIFIALPSLSLLYLLDEVNNPLISMKWNGYQWYWSYELSDFTEIEFDSYMVPRNEISSYNFRQLDVDNRLLLPFKSQLGMMMLSPDVIHSWTIPALSVKVVAVFYLMSLLN